MNCRATLLVVLACLSIAGSVTSASAEPIDVSQLEWSVAALIDQSREPFPESEPVNLPGQFNSPRDMRGMAISPNGRYLYVGYNNSIAGPLPDGDRQGEVRRIDLTVTGPNKFDTQWSGRELGNRGKAIAVDDVGRVYLADAGRIDVYNADLSSKLFTIDRPANTNFNWEGVAVKREGGNLMLYVSDRQNGTLAKAQLTEFGATITAATPVASFGVGGIKLLANTAASLRNVEIDGNGNIWVAGKDNNTLYRVSPNGSVVQSATITNPFDIGFNGTQVFVTHQNQRVLSVFEISQFENNTIPTIASGIAPPWAALNIDSNGNEETQSPGLLSGIVVLPGRGFFLGNENGQTQGQKSLYGVTDLFSGNGFQDNFFDDNEPVFFAALPVPEPAACVLALTALVAFGGYARRQKRHS